MKRLFTVAIALVMFTTAQAASYDLLWDTPTEDPRITGYELHWGSASGNYDSMVPVAGYLTNEVTISTDQSVSYAAVRTAGMNGSTPLFSSFSNEVILLDNVPPPDLPPPGNFRVVDIDDTAFAVYRFEGNDAVVEDETGVNNGTLVTDATRVTYGKYGHGIDFNGSSGMVDLGAMDVDGDGMTISLWMSAYDFGIYDARLVSKATGVSENDHYWMLSTFTNNSIRFRLKAGGSTTTLISATGVIATGEWHHVAATYDGAEMRILVDGIEVGAASKEGPVDVSSGTPVAIGSQPQGSNFFDGTLDEVKFFNYALTDEQLALTMAAP